MIGVSLSLLIRDNGRHLQGPEHSKKANTSDVK